MLRSKALGSAVGIQHQGGQEQSKINVGQASRVGIIAGYFRRGGKGIFPVTQNDYRERLGHEPLNPFYIAVSDALKFFPIVWVLRLVNSTGGGSDISCAGATDSATLGPCTEVEILEYFVNGVSIGSNIGRNVYAGAFESIGLRVIPLLSDGSINTDAPYYSNTQYQRFENLTSETIRVKVIGTDAQGIDSQLVPLNPTVIFNPSLSNVEFCLTPIQQDINCSLTEVIWIVDQSWNSMDETGYKKSIKLYDEVTRQLLAFAEEPIEADIGDYPNILPNFVISANESNHELYAEYFIDENNDNVLRIRSTASICKKLRLEIFVGNEGRCIAKTVPSNPNDLVMINPIDYEDYLITPVISIFCLCYSDISPQPTFLRLQPSSGNTLFSGVADDLTLINSANEIVYGN